MGKRGEVGRIGGLGQWSRDQSQVKWTHKSDRVDHAEADPSTSSG
jgi:hypothetical protein